MTSTVTTGWSFGELYPAIARAWPQRPALVHGDVVRTWAEFDDRSARLAMALLEAGLRGGDAVAVYLPNGPEYLETFAAACRSRLVPMNTNFRYGEDELLEIWQDADVKAVVYDASFADRVAALRSRMPGVRAWLQVGGTRPVEGVSDSEDVIAGSAPLTAVPDAGRSPILLYTGGTTGRPKGVVWHQRDLLSLLNSLTPQPLPDQAAGSELAGAVAARRKGTVALVASPLMHGAGLFYALSELTRGSTVVTLPSVRFDPVLLLDTIVERSVRSVAIVGDAFARPLLTELDARPDRWDLSGVRAVVSSGALWSASVKQGLLRHMPGARMIDGLGSSEASGVASAQATADGIGEAAVFQASDRAAVIHDDGTLATPGDGRIGRLAVTGWLPQGYLNDPVKSAEVFVEAAGRRWSIPGDRAELLADDRIRLWGRGSSCINTGGEKVFPEEVEEVLKEHPAVADAAVVGVPDERFGQSIVALVERMGGQEPDPGDLVVHVRGRLAGYKAPKLVAFVPRVARLDNGKLDYPSLTAEAERLRAPAS